MNHDIDTKHSCKLGYKRVVFFENIAGSNICHIVTATLVELSRAQLEFTASTEKCDSNTVQHNFAGASTQRIESDSCASYSEPFLVHLILRSRKECSRGELYLSLHPLSQLYNNNLTPNFFLLTTTTSYYTFQIQIIVRHPVDPQCPRLLKPPSYDVFQLIVASTTFCTCAIFSSYAQGSDSVDSSFTDFDDVRSEKRVRISNFCKTYIRIFEIHFH